MYLLLLLLLCIYEYFFFPLKDILKKKEAFFL